jgi:hypothetical protein
MKRMLISATIALVFSTVALAAAPRADSLATIDLNVPAYAAAASSASLNSIFDKCGTSNRVELVLFALRNGLARL